MARYLVNKADGNLTLGVSTKVDWVCPNCGSIIRAKAINKVVWRDHIPCAVCGPDVSRPEKIALCALKQAGVEVECQKIFKWSQLKRYDFFLPELNAIIEVNGAQHYGFGFKNLSGFSLDDQIRNDVMKKDMAISNGVEHYFVIYAADVPAQQIVSEISVALASMGITVPISCSKCEQAALSKTVSETASLWNDGMTVTEIENKIGRSRNAVISYLKRASDIGLCRYSEYEARKRGNRYRWKSDTQQRRRAVRCKTTGVVFDSLAEAVRAYGIYSSSNIKRACDNPARHAGELNGQKLSWEYV